MSEKQGSALQKFNRFQTAVSGARGAIAKAVTGGLNPAQQEDFLLALYRSNTNLRDCSEQSILASAMEANRRSLSLNPSLGHAYLIPYKRTCTFQAGYKGLIYLMKKFGGAAHVFARVVYENDLFDCDFATEFITHKPPVGGGERGKMIGVYAVAVFPTGTRQWEYLYKDDVDKIMKSSRGSGNASSPWKQWYDEMAKKTAVRRLFKYVDVPEEISNLFASEDSDDNGARVELTDGTVYDGTTGEVVDEPAAAPREVQTSEAPAKPGNGADPGPAGGDWEADLKGI
jgi:recombination protein RecT